MSERYSARRDRLRSSLKKYKCDALLITNETNVTYLTGFTGDSSYLVVLPDGDVILSDFRYTEQIEEECPGLEMSIRGFGSSMIEVLKKLLNKLHVARCGIEAQSLTLGTYNLLCDKLKQVDLIPTAGLVEELRMIKDRDEIETIRKSVDIAARGFQLLRSSLMPEQSEIDLRDDLEYNMRRFGAQDRGFPSIIAVGPRAALPHAVPTDRKVESAPILLVDWGARTDLYVSDLTRVLVTGKLSTKFEKIYNIVLKAQTEAIAAIKPGVTGDHIDNVARSVIKAAGYNRRFGHGLGHGIGLEVHENPRMGKNCETVLKPGMVVTVEPGIYLPGWGGVRIEDDVLVTRTGNEVLSEKVPKQLEDMIVE